MVPKARVEAEAALLGDAWHPRKSGCIAAMRNCNSGHRVSRPGDETAIVFEFGSAAQEQGGAAGSGGAPVETLLSVPRVFKLSHFLSRSHTWQAGDRPCYMNSLMTESFFTM
jgi:hypothetical protein